MYENLMEKISALTHIALRKAKIVCNFGLSECNSVKKYIPCWSIKTLSFQTFNNIQ